ncbi:MAG: double zinc ribbon domain-containing protein [Spirochaetaceae bacterium]|nr:double zinc ribbon domain-containing protein [Spirochaetaceae bacterium]
MNSFFGTARSRVGGLVREWCFSSGCVVCGGILLNRDDAFYGICESCRNRLSPVREQRCAHCGRRLVSETSLCMDCRDRTGRSLGPSFSFFPYAGDYRTLMGAYKYGKNRNVGNFLARIILRKLPLFVDPSEIPECWVPVPPRPGTLKKTGWDQVAFLCRCLERLRRLEPDGAGLRDFYICPRLRRLPSRSQKELNREDRLSNLKGRIRCTGPVPDRVLLLDDVVTTGATLEAAASVLKEGGASEVMGLTLFYD